LTSTGTSSNGLCGNYASSTVFSIAGNNNVIYSVVKIIKPHLSDPTIYDSAPTAKDNTMTTTVKAKCVRCNLQYALATTSTGS